ncbi:MAG: DNA repair protein RecN [Verrucomicrobiota bacterium]
MLQYLKISNLALLDEVTLEFENGFTSVTGETGAGKSVLLGALSLLSGARTEKTMIRQGEDELSVEAALYFEDSRAIDASLESLGLAQCEDGVLVLNRSVHRSKMPRIQVNGRLATLAQLKELGETWIDFHGPGEPQKLLQERRQLEMLDLFAGNKPLLDQYQNDYNDWRKSLAEVQDLETGERLDVDEIEFVRQQIKKIEAVEVDEDSINALERDYTRMSRAQELISLAAECSEGMIGDDGLSAQLGTIVSRLGALVELDEASEPLAERARSLLIELQDLGNEIEHLASDFEFDEESVQAVSERMDLWQELRRKYGGSVEAVLAKHRELTEKLAVQGDLEGLLVQKREAAQLIENSLKQQAAKLTKSREKAAGILSEKAMQLLKSLGFKKAGIEIKIIQEETLNDYGDSRCCFLFAPNAGQERLPLSKIASSGETARMMLALKTVLAESDATPLLVFDEVDANVGGEVGRAVGMELARLASRHQVFCVTHLPQVASLAQSHFVVTKAMAEDATCVSIKPIHGDSNARLQELARMLGDRKSSSALAHAEELLSS